MFFKSIHKRLKIVSIIVAILFLFIILKVFYIQFFSYKKLNKLASSLWNRNLPIEANRGIIYDRNGKVLAGNITTTSLVLIPNQIKDKEKAASQLAEILNVSYEEMLKHVSKKTSIERVHPEGRRLSYEIADKIKELNLAGVYLVKESKRDYPYNSLMSHTLGFVGIDNQGLAGLELIYDKYLTGSNGAIKYYSDAKGNSLSIPEAYVKPQDGMNITLTIDLDIQSSLERELDNTISKYNPDGVWAIVMDPNNGDILAMGSRPNFEPANYQKYDISSINRNLPIWMTYEPGSTFKIITLAASLEEKTIDLNDHFFDSGSIKVGGATLHCWRHGGHGEETYLEVVENSCNPGFVNMGLKLGKETLFKYIHDFGFGQRTGIELNGEENGIIFNIDKIGDLELATTAFGQGVSVTALQQIIAVSAVINGGYLYKPNIVKSINEPELNNVIKDIQPSKIRQVISKETSKEVRYVLESVVARGTGHNAYIPGYRVGGKTGTAQKVKDGVYMSGNYITSFIGFMPADDPKVIVYVAVDNAKGVTQYGGTIAAPIAKNILLDTIDILNIEPRDNEIEKEYVYLDKVYTSVPNVIGLNYEEAKTLLKDFKVLTIGEGNVKYQSPKANSKIEIGTEVRLFLSN